MEEKELAYPNKPQKITQTRKKILRKTKPATLSEYNRWLKGFLETGAKPTHYYDYSFIGVGFRIAMEDIKLNPLYSTDSFNIIVPEGIKVEGEGAHCEIFYMDGYRTEKGFVPVYKDTIGYRLNAKEIMKNYLKLKNKAIHRAHLFFTTMNLRDADKCTLSDIHVSEDRIDIVLMSQETFVKHPVYLSPSDISKPEEEYIESVKKKKKEIINDVTKNEYTIYEDNDIFIRPCSFSEYYCIFSKNNKETEIIDKKTYKRIYNKEE